MRLTQSVFRVAIAGVTSALCRWCELAQQNNLLSIAYSRCDCFSTERYSVTESAGGLLKSSLSFSGSHGCRWQRLVPIMGVPVMMGKRSTVQNTTTQPRACAASRQQLAQQRNLLGGCNLHSEVIFELLWFARVPLARSGCDGHDGKTSWRRSKGSSIQCCSDSFSASLFAVNLRG
jgi:hypothetical protein